MLLREHILSDEQFSYPYIDVDEWHREKNVYRYVHGGFKNTDIRFSFYFPEKNKYEGRFIHFMLPITGSEDSSRGLERIDFALEHGAYFVESNMGGLASVGEYVFQSSAATAQYSRIIAVQMYGEHIPYGYIYGGSGGAFKTISCVQSTNVWDGSVPLVMGSPMAMPNVFTVRAHAFRILRSKLESIADAMEPGGDKTVFESFDVNEKEAFEELSKMGFPASVWFAHESMGLGALPVFMPILDQVDPRYFEDFWTKPGYYGTDIKGSAARDRLQLVGKIKDCYLEYHEDSDEKVIKSGVDDAWQNLKSIDLSKFQPWVVLDQMPSEGAYVAGAKLKVLSGKAKGKSLPLRYIKEGRLYIDEGFNMPKLEETLKLLEIGDELQIDNSDFIAVQTYHRHQVPEGDYPVWDQFRDSQGRALFPQRASIIGPMLTYGGAGSIQNGNFHGKMIVVEALMDESAFPWQADWYKKRVIEQMGDAHNACFRLWFMEHAMHGDHDKEPDTLHVSGYSGAEYQALLDLIQWVENGIKPLSNTNYQVVDGQVIVPYTARERGGIQPVIRLTILGEKFIKIQRGKLVEFEAEIEVPEGAGYITKIAWSFDGDKTFPVETNVEQFLDSDDIKKVVQSYQFDLPGTYFVVISVTIERNGAHGNSYTQIKNLDRVRVVVL